MPPELDMPALTADQSIFICPQAKLPLRPMSLNETKQALGSAELVPRSNAEPAPFGITATMLVRSDGACAYPVVDGVPVLLAPEQITPADRPQHFDLKDV